MKIRSRRNFWIAAILILILDDCQNVIPGIGLQSYPIQTKTVYSLKNGIFVHALINNDSLFPKFIDICEGFKSEFRPYVYNNDMKEVELTKNGEIRYNTGDGFGAGACALAFVWPLSTSDMEFNLSDDYMIRTPGKYYFSVGLTDESHYWQRQHPKVPFTVGP